MVAIRDNIRGGALTETTFLVLLSAYKPCHGYGIMQFIENQTNGRVVLGAGTLYGAINTLEKRKWIAPFGYEKSSKKKEYLITDIGKEIVEEELIRLDTIIQLATSIIEGEKNNG